MTRLDPDGNEKRRARKGERVCCECDHYHRPKYIPASYGIDYWGEGYENPPERRRAMCEFWDEDGFKGGSCRADDFAGDCKRFCTDMQELGARLASFKTSFKARGEGC